MLQGLSYVAIYLDDILIHSPNESSPVQHLQEVFDQLYCGATKNYLHDFSADGVQSQQKIQSISDWPTPAGITQVRQFLCLASHYRHYI